MQYGDNQAYWRGDQVVVLQPDKAPQTFRFQREGFTFGQPIANTALEREALAHALWGSLAYRRGLYPPTVERSR